MEKIKKPPSYSSGPVKLYLDEIADIANFLQEIDNSGKIEIEVGGYSFSSVDELLNSKGKEFREISIYFTSNSLFPRLHFWTSEYFSHIDCYEDDLVYLGAFGKIEKLLNSCRRKWQWVVTLYYLVLGLGITLSLFNIIDKLFEEPISTYIAIGNSLIMLIAIFFYFSTIQTRKNKIILEYRTNHNTFWKRNKDKLIVGFFSSIITFFLTIIGALIIQSIRK